MTESPFMLKLHVITLRTTSNRAPACTCRAIWNPYHHNVGRLVILLGFANVIMGLYLGGQGWGWYLGVGLFWLATWLAAGASLACSRRRWSHARSTAATAPQGSATSLPAGKRVV